MTKTDSQTSSPPSGRLEALDAFRGAIMLLMASGGLGLAQIAKSHPDSVLWGFVARQVDHVAWSGCVLWDLIQPAFMFMVGVALPWSIAHRRAASLGFSSMLPHALWRSLLLVVLAVFLTSAWSPRTDWIFPNVLAQIGLGYPVVFLVAFTRPRTQLWSAFSILAVYWLAFALYPLPPTSLNAETVGWSKDWIPLAGFEAHWNKNTNFAAWFDSWFLNLFPRDKPFVYNSGGYQTLNFVPSMATMIFGVMTGGFLRQNLEWSQKLQRLLVVGLLAIGLGKVIELLGLCPIVKRIWTPSWALYSTGWVILMLCGFVAVMEWKRYRSWAFPLVVAGLNPISLYVLWQLMGGFIRENLKRHLGPNLFETFGAPCVTALERGSTLLILWLILFWMYRNRFFVRL